MVLYIILSLFFSHCRCSLRMIYQLCFVYSFSFSVVLLFVVNKDEYKERKRKKKKKMKLNKTLCRAPGRVRPAQNMYVA